MEICEILCIIIIEQALWRLSIVGDGVFAWATRIHKLNVNDEEPCMANDLCRRWLDVTVEQTLTNRTLHNLAGPIFGANYFHGFSRNSKQA